MQSASGPSSFGPSDPLLGTPAAEHAFAGGVIAAAVLVALVAVLALRRAAGGPAEHLRPYAIGVLAAAVTWSVAHALVDKGSSDALQLFVASGALLGILVALTRRPSRLVVAVGSIIVLPDFVVLVVASGPSERWTTNEGLFWGALLGALTATPFLVAYAVTAALASIGRWNSRNSTSSSAGPIP